MISVLSATLRGVEAIPVTVEVTLNRSLPGISIVGIGDIAVQEAKERVRSAIRTSGFSMPRGRVIVNLAPSDIKKVGTGFDLPIALGILAETGQIPPSLLNDRMFVGELSLDGAVRSVSGTLAYGICANDLGLELVTAGTERIPIDSLTHLKLSSLMQTIMAEDLPQVESAKIAKEIDLDAQIDFADVAGHEMAKRAAQIAAAGNHGILMVGPPGSGKTMLASRMVTILPPLTEQEMLETALVHSVAGEDIYPILQGRRPFRTPHHSSTRAGLIGGGRPLRPGEISLAHHGALFLDELGEFSTGALQCLRQPMESGKVCLTRADGNVVFPSKFMLIAASNPCPCGFYGDKEHQCNCTDLQIRRYQGKIGGPLIDRIDIHIDVDRLPPSSIMDSGNGTSSAHLREGVMKALAFKEERVKKSRGDCVLGNIIRDDISRSSMSSKQIIDSCKLSKKTKDFVVQMAEANHLSGRALVNTLRVARTIADLGESLSVKVEHVAEALGLRIRDEIGSA